jgi:16S rRNA (guanine527-N7)-methyltransferase
VLRGELAEPGLIAGRPEPVFLDLGSGAGVPGLVLARCWGTADATLVDSSRRKCAFLERAVVELSLDDRVRVRRGRAETLARATDLRGCVDLVVARGFGRPAVTAECAVGFLRSGGRLAVTEPPPGSSGSRAENRWPVEPLGKLGFGPARVVRSGSMGVAIMTALREPDERWPRGTGRPAKSPLW